MPIHGAALCAGRAREMIGVISADADPYSTRLTTRRARPGTGDIDITDDETSKTVQPPPPESTDDSARDNDGHGQTVVTSVACGPLVSWVMV